MNTVEVYFKEVLEMIKVVNREIKREGMKGG